MDTIKAIKTRRSIRKFTGEKISRESIETIVRCAMQAPSAINEQPWHFVVIEDRKMLDTIHEFSPYAPTHNAPCAILVLAHTSHLKIKNYWVQDCSAAIQNMLLAIHDLGLGAVWTGIPELPGREEGFRKQLDLPDEALPLGLIVLGHPASTVDPEDRYIPERVHWNKW